MKNALIIIPAYNEEASIAKVVKDIEDKAPAFDYVIINDCSKDSTPGICRKNGYNFVDLPLNLGIGGAVQTGYKYAYENGYEYAVQIDGDGQHDPQFLETMLEKIQENGADMLIGSRFIDNEGFQSSFMRRFGIKWLSNLIKLLTGTCITDPTSGLRMGNRKVIEEFSKLYPKDYPEPESEIFLLNRGYTVKEMPVIMRERQGGTSSISPIKSAYYMIKVSIALLMEKTR